jgi:formyl-CoA transferase
VPAGAVLDTGELMGNAHLQERGMFATIEHPTRGKVMIPGFPVKLSDSKVPVTSAPLLGEHTEEVLTEWLGLSAEAAKEYRNATPLKIGKAA